MLNEKKKTLYNCYFKSNKEMPCIFTFLTFIYILLFLFEHRGRAFYQIPKSWKIWYKIWVMSREKLDILICLYILEKSMSQAIKQGRNLINVWMYKQNPNFNFLFISVCIFDWRYPVKMNVYIWKVEYFCYFPWIVS